jgi:hypothetical protein
MPNNIIEFKSISNQQSRIAMCFVDRTPDAATDWIREIVKNQADYTVSNVTGKFYDVYQGLDEQDLLNHVADLGYEFAVVFSTGTEFINGYDFFTYIESLTDTDVALAGHILDRGTAYYELHSQCYYINLRIYDQQGRPSIGTTELGSTHQQISPTRSLENFHDNYTPLWISKGTEIKDYDHKCHGWNILSCYLSADLKIIAFSEEIKKSKIHLYPEYVNDFNKNVGWIYHRQNICATSFVHTDNTEWPFTNTNLKIKQIITPASGLWYTPLLTEDPMNVVFYDYNLNSLEYWKKHAPQADSVEYKFVHVDLLGDSVNFRDIIDLTLLDHTLFNLSNIFCYEGTSCLYSTAYRIYKENQLLQHIKDIAPNAYIVINMRASGTFNSPSDLHGEIIQAKDIRLTEISKLKKPTWRMNNDWL